MYPFLWPCSFPHIVHVSHTLGASWFCIIKALELKKKITRKNHRGPEKKKNIGAKMIDWSELEQRDGRWWSSGGIKRGDAEPCEGGIWKRYDISESLSWITWIPYEDMVLAHSAVSLNTLQTLNHSAQNLLSILAWPRVQCGNPTWLELEGKLASELSVSLRLSLSPSLPLFLLFPCE